MNRHSIPRLILIANAILLLALSLNSLLSIVSFEKIYREHLITDFRIVGSDLKQKIETAVNFGKPIEKFYGLKFLIKHYLGMSEKLKGITVTLPDMTLLSSSLSGQEQARLAGLSPPVFKENPEVSNSEHKAFQVDELRKDFLVVQPVYQDNQKWVGNVLISFEKKQVTRHVARMVKKSLVYLMAVLGISFVMMCAALYLGNLVFRQPSDTDSERAEKKARKRNYLIIVLILIFAQCGYAWLNNVYFKQQYIRVVGENIQTLSKLVKNEVDRILKMGIEVSRLKKVDVLLEDILGSVPECRQIYIQDANRVVQYIADKSGASFSEALEENEISPHLTRHSISVPLGAQGDKGYAVFVLDGRLINRQVRGLAVDALTVIVTSILFGFEMLMLSSVFSFKPGRFMRQAAPGQVIGKGYSKFTILRSVSFIFFFAEYVPLAFLPIFIKNIYETAPVAIFGLTPETILSLPISAYMLGVSIFVLVAGALMERLSLARSFVLFGALLVIGSALSAFSMNVYQLIVFRFISGLGYGGVLMAGITLIINNTDHHDRTSGFGYWLIGNSTATICAVPIGSVVAQYMGYRSGLLLSALFSCTLILFILYLSRREQLREMFEKEGIRVGATDEEKQKGFGAVNRFRMEDLLCVFKDRNVFSSLFFIAIPVQIALVGFLHYAFPLYLDSVGISQANIGRFTTLFGLSYIACVPFVSKWSDKMGNERIFMIFGSLIIGLILIFFFYADNIYMILVVIAVIGAGNAFTTSTTGSYITLTAEADRIGSSKLSSIFNTYQKLLTVLGPMLIGFLISSYGYMSAMNIIGMLIVFALVFFIFTSRRLRGGGTGP